MITFEMLTAAVYSLLGLAALVVALTQVFKNWAAHYDWYKNAVAANKKWPGHLLSFISSIICVGAVLFIGLYFQVGVFALFCLTCWDSWLMLIGTIIGCTGVANGAWSYEFMQKILEWIKLLPKPTNNDTNDND